MARKSEALASKYKMLSFSKEKQQKFYNSLSEDDKALLIVGRYRAMPDNAKQAWRAANPDATPIIDSIVSEKLDLGKAALRGVVPAYAEEDIGRPTDPSGLENVLEGGIEGVKLASEILPDFLIDNSVAGRAMPVGAAALSGAATAGIKRAEDSLGLGIGKLAGVLPKDKDYSDQANQEAMLAGGAAAGGSYLGRVMSKGLGHLALSGGARSAAGILENMSNKELTRLGTMTDEAGIPYHISQGKKLGTKVQGSADEAFAGASSLYDDLNEGYDWRLGKPPKEKAKFLKGKDEVLEGSQDVTDVYNKLPNSPAKERIKKVLDIKPVMKINDQGVSVVDKAATKIRTDRALKNATDKEVEAMYRIAGEESDVAKLASQKSQLKAVQAKLNQDYIPNTKFKDAHELERAAIEATSDDAGKINKITGTGMDNPKFDRVTEGSSVSDKAFNLGDSGLSYESRGKLKGLNTGEGAVGSREITDSVLNRELSSSKFIEPGPAKYSVEGYTPEQLEAAQRMAGMAKNVDSGNFLKDFSSLKQTAGDISELQKVTPALEEGVSSSGLKNYNSGGVNKAMQAPEIADNLRAMGVAEEDIAQMLAKTEQAANNEMLFKAAEKSAGNTSFLTAAPKVKAALGGLTPEQLINSAVFTRYAGAPSANFLRSGLSNSAN